MRLVFKEEYGALTKLGIPITIGQLGITLQNIVDNMMVGQHSTEELAAAGFVNNMFILALLLTVGYSAGAVSHIGSLYSQGKKLRIVEILKSSIIADLLQGMIIVAILVGLYYGLPFMGQPDELVPIMRPYLVIQILSLPFMVATGAFKQFTDSINDTEVAMGVMLAGNVWNIFWNWVLIFGKLGFPEMGIEGAAWATFSSRALMLVLNVLIFVFMPRYKKYRLHWKEAQVKKNDLLSLNRLGWPIAIQMGIETASFSLVAIVLGWMGTTTLAAHQVMVNISSMLFMFYVGIGNAVSIRVSNYSGLKDVRGVRHAAFAGYEMIVASGIVLSILVFSFRRELSFMFTDSEEVADIVSLLAYPLIMYQVGDSMQINFANALRGLGDVKMLMRYSIIAYIIISLPMSYILGVTLNWGAFGVWMGFPFGLTTAAVLYLRRFLRVTRGGIWVKL